MSFSIRTAIESDVPYFYSICLQTGNSGSDASSLYSDPLLIGQYFAAPYFFYDKSLCYIAEIDATPQGYLVAVQNTQDYRTWLTEAWLPKLRERYPVRLLKETQLSANQQNLIRLIHSDHTDNSSEDMLRYEKFPAHLHIDLLPTLQGKGCGRALMETLFTELKKRNCPGLHLGVDKANIAARAFYQKIGFTSIEETSWGNYLGISFKN